MIALALALAVGCEPLRNPVEPARVLFSTDETLYECALQEAGDFDCDAVFYKEERWGGQPLRALDLDGDGGQEVLNEQWICDVVEGEWRCEQYIDVTDTNMRAVVDYDGDGDDEFLLPHQAAPLEVCWSDSGALSCGSTGVEVSLTTNATAADFNADGALDLLVGVRDYTYETASQICLGDDSGGFVCEQWMDSEISTRSIVHELSPGDFDGDGDVDLLVSWAPDRNGPPEICLNDGDGSFDCSLFVTVGAIYNGAILDVSPTSVEVHDLNSDGALDFAAASLVGPLVCWGDGTGGFNCERIAPFDDESDIATIGEPAAPDIGVGDYDGDGDLDLISPLNDGEVEAIACTNTDGAFECVPIEGLFDVNAGVIAAP